MLTTLSNLDRASPSEYTGWSSSPGRGKVCWFSPRSYFLSLWNKVFYKDIRKLIMLIKMLKLAKDIIHYFKITILKYSLKKCFYTCTCAIWVNNFTLLQLFLLCVQQFRIWSAGWQGQMEKKYGLGRNCLHFPQISLVFYPILSLTQIVVTLHLSWLKM